ncbi:lactose permease [Grosmannia clavigera kw1407]|uniref:Lactose permease n=1 Tax=Grosmannia clavigera (strain kw1407 / UAMH 11150) TaxID=655863 RepID=F0XDZ0_GROCL|nr:lactose permease [Grosmannia clavigera kw1407]EFX04592.1 lactose permease [Grosmannia clavigera kw1407]
MVSGSRFVSDKSAVILTLVFATAVFNDCTQGYDQSSMNNMNLVNTYTFILGINLLGLNVAIINAGSVIGGLSADQVCDRWGRKAGIIQAAAVHEAMFCIGRFFLGAAVTLNGVSAPTWVMDIAHPKTRGLLGDLYMAICLLALSLLPFTPESPLFALSLLPFTPESPLWLVSQDRHEEALQLLAVLHGNGDADNSFVQADPLPNFRRFGIVIVLNIAAQVIGSNIVSSYIGNVLDSAGITNTRQQLITNIGMIIFNFGCAIAGPFAMDYMGRKGMLLGASCLMTVLSALYGDGSNKAASNGMMAIIFLFLGSYSFRAKGLAVGQMACYAFMLVSQYTTPIAMNNIDWEEKNKAVFNRARQ